MVQNVIGRGRGFWVGSFLESVTPAGGFVTSLLKILISFFKSTNYGDDADGDDADDGGRDGR